MKIKLLSIVSVFLFGLCNAQDQNQQFFATMDAQNAKELQRQFPNEVNIIEANDKEAAVKITEKAAHSLHRKILSHGPGFVYQNSQESAIKKINANKKSANRILDFNISENALVLQSINLVNAENIKNHIQILENYGTRRHTTTNAKQSILDLKTKWEAMITAAGRDDIKVRIVDHINTPMPSLVMTITGKESPNEYVIVGGHADSISNNNVAPGADDNASGISTITEMIRVLLDVKFQPKKTVEFMAFAAEEVGLLGSNEIATEYANNNVDVMAFVQFDMTNYKGSTKDIYLTTDSYNSSDLNIFLMELMEQYNKTGTHSFTYGNTICNYGCSDHFSWAQNGYPSAFPFEATMNQSNPRIHTSGDTLSVSGNNATHAAKFAKLGLEFIIESAKSYHTMSVADTSLKSIQVIAKNNNLQIIAADHISYNTLAILDTSGKKIFEKTIDNNTKQVDISNLTKGIYLAIITTKDGKTIAQKFINQ